MAQDNEEDTFSSEVDSRLDELFAESDEPEAAEREVPREERSPLKELKASILSVDWEISDKIMDELMEELVRLRSFFEKDKTVLLFLQLLGSVAKYIKSNKADAHPDAIKLLTSAFEDLEKVVLTEGMSDKQKQNVLRSDVKRFRKLKEDIAEKKKRKRESMSASLEGKEPKIASMAEEETPMEEFPQPEQAAEAAPQMPPDFPAEMPGEEPLEQPGEHPLQAGGEHLEEKHLEIDEGVMSPHEAFIYALEEIKQLLTSEFSALRTELKLWREGQ